VPANTATLVIAVVLSQLDYVNGVLVCLPAYHVRRLQSVLNAPAHKIFQLRHSQQITHDSRACQSILIARPGAHLA